MAGHKAAPAKLQHSVKVPQFYKTAANIAKRVTEERCSLKELVFNANKHLNIQGLYALIIKTFHHEDTLERLIKESKILKERKVDPWLIRILITELLFGKQSLSGDSKPVQAVLSYHQMFLAELKETEKAGSHKLDAYQKRDCKPRYVRVNTLTLKVRAALKIFRDEGWKQVDYNRKAEDYASFLHRVASLAEDEFIQDLNIKELFIFPNKTEFYKHPLYLEGSIILQDKASCLASWLLNPLPGSTVLDMCAAPGMKTTHLAARMKNRGTLYAVDIVEDRYKTLCKQVEKYGATCVKTVCMDAFQLDAERCPGVQYILVDPTCSGSGALKPPMAKREETCSVSRLRSLTRLQAKMLRFALTKFPDVQRVVYSTCSVNSEENEGVVEEVLASVNTDASNPVFQVVDDKLKNKWIHHGSQDFECGSKCICTKSDVDFTTGFFIAVFERVQCDEKNTVSSESEENGHKKRKKHKKNEIRREVVD